MVAVGIMMGPVQHATPLVPFVLTADPNAIALAKRDPFGKIDVMSDEQGLTVGELDQESLMARAFTIVRKPLFNAGIDRHHEPGLALREGACDALIVVARSRRSSRIAIRTGSGRRGVRGR